MNSKILEKTMSPFQIAIISIFPEMFQTIINYGITRKAIKKNIININILNPRDYVKNKYRNIDDRPYGGGFGMLMKAEPLKLAIEHAKSIIKSSAKVLYLSPKGSKLNQKKISVLSKKKRIILLCGRYQGIDERLIHSKIIDEEISIGDYILSGGELPAMILIDMLCRLLPGALGKNRLKSYDSFHNGLLECPHYTRPKVFQNISVPNILLSGNHKAIKTWRLKQSLGQTWQKRPDLLKKIVLTQEKIDLLEQFKKDILQVK